MWYVLDGLASAQTLFAPQQLEVPGVQPVRTAGGLAAEKFELTLREEEVSTQGGSLNSTPTRAYSREYQVLS